MTVLSKGSVVSSLAGPSAGILSPNRRCHLGVPGEPSPLEVGVHPRLGFTCCGRPARLLAHRVCNPHFTPDLSQLHHKNTWSTCGNPPPSQFTPPPRPGKRSSPYVGSPGFL